MLMLLVAGGALIFWALRFRQQNADMSRSWTHLQIWDLAHGEAPQRRTAAEALGRVPTSELEMALPPLQNALRDGDPAVRRIAAAGIGRLIHAAAEARKGEVGAEIGAATPDLMRLLTDPDAGARAEAAGTLGSLAYEMQRRRIDILGVDSNRVLTALAKASSDPDSEVRWQAVFALGLVASKDADAPPQLLTALDDPELNVRRAAIASLAQPWRNSGALWMPILAQLKSPELEIRACVGWSITQMGPPPQALLPALIAATRTDDLVVKLNLPIVIGRLGKAARPALPRLGEIAREQLARGDNFTAIEAIVAIDPDCAEAQSFLAPLVEVLKTGRPIEPLSADAVAAEKEYGPGIFSALRQQTLVTLNKYRSSAAAAVPELIEAMRDQPEIRERVLHILGVIGQATKSALPKLVARAREEIRDRSPTLLYGNAIATLDPASAEAQSLVPPLLDVMLSAKNKFDGDARAAYSLLTRLIPHAADFSLPTIRARLKEAGPAVRDLADALLHQIDRTTAPAD
jgi:HEAT repeat protein